jgi:hypothetical protein
VRIIDGTVLDDDLGPGADRGFCCVAVQDLVPRNLFDLQDARGRLVHRALEHHLDRDSDDLDCLG